MTRALAIAALVVVGGLIGFALAGRGSDRAVALGPPPRAEATVDADVAPVVSRTSFSFEVWFVRGGDLTPALRMHEPTRAVARAALEALLAGPVRRDRTAGLGTAVPDETRLLGVGIRGGVATVDLSSEYEAGAGSRALRLRLGQVVYTVTQFPTVAAVRFQVDGRPVNVFSGAGGVLEHPVRRADYQTLSPFGPTVTGAWQLLPAAPIATDEGRAASVWTGDEMLVLGRVHRTPAKSVTVAASYDPATRRWRRLAPPPGSPRSPGGRLAAVWTGRELLAWGDGVGLSYRPRTNRWRTLPRPPLARPVGAVWTGRQLLGWEISGRVAAYDPSSNRWRTLPPSPLPRGAATGAWTGRELVLVRGRRGAAYDARAGTWRRIAAPPRDFSGAVAVWGGHEILPVGPELAFAYDHRTDRWRRLRSMEYGRVGAAAVWTGRRLLVWGGETRLPEREVIPPHGLAYDPAANRWSPLPQAPLVGRVRPTAVWTGRALLVWGGAGLDGRSFSDGAAFTPVKP